MSAPPPPYDVRLAEVGEADAVAAVCRAGFATSSRGLLAPDVIERQADAYYDVDRVRREIETAGDGPRWQGYVVAVTHTGDVLGAAGGGLTGVGVGQLYVIYLDLALRGCGVGTALLDLVTGQQRASGASEQWVSVTEGNEMGVPFYLARGFTVRDRVPYTTVDGEHTGAFSLRMSRRL